MPRPWELVPNSTFSARGWRRESSWPKSGVRSASTKDKGPTFPSMRKVLTASDMANRGRGKMGLLFTLDGVRSATVIEVQITADRRAGLGHAIVASQIDLLVFDAAPQSLDEDVVAPGALAVHADCDAVLDQHAGEGGAHELRALVRVEGLRLTVLCQRLLQRLNAEFRLHCDRHPPCQNPATEPLDHPGQEPKAPRHGDVR